MSALRPPTRTAAHVSHGMILDGYVLPLPGRSVAVVFWDRVRRTAGDSALSIYAPGELSAGELSEVMASLAASVGAVISEQRRAGPPLPHLVLWWLAGCLALAAAVLHALDAGPPFAWLAAAALGTTLPWGMTAGATLRGRRHTAAQRVRRAIGSLEPVNGADARMRERTFAVWHFARAQRGSEVEQVRALERFCEEQAWPAAAAMYRERLAPAVTTGRFFGGGRSTERSRLFAAKEMRAWHSS